MKTRYKIALLFTCLFLGISGWHMGYARMNMGFDTPKLPTTDEIVAVETIAPVYETKDTITPFTNIILKHFDTTTAKVSEVGALAPSFMLNKTGEELKNTFAQWEILSFSSEEVVMQRQISSIPPVEYTISHIGGFVTVFYGKMEEGNIKEVTRIPISHLHEDEIKRLDAGILVQNMDELVRRLEDLGS